VAIKKKFLKSKPMCKVTLKLTKEQVKSAKVVHVVGEFNNWDTRSTPMKGLKNGGFATTFDLKTGKEYQFRYLLEEREWENDWDADKYVPSGYGDCENSVIIV